MVPYQSIDSFLREQAAKMVSYIRTRFDTPQFSPVIQVTFAANRRVSRGGVRRGQSFIKIAAHHYLVAANTPTGKTDFIEYPSFNGDPVIGGLQDVSWKKALACLVAHELGHALQFDRYSQDDAKKALKMDQAMGNDGSLRVHGTFWKRIYADLRRQFINGQSFEDCPVEPAPEVKSVDRTKTVEDTTPTVQPKKEGTLYVKYKYKGNGTYAWFYIDQKLVAVIAEIGRKFFRADPFGDNLELLPFDTMAAARRHLIGQ